MRDRRKFSAFISSTYEDLKEERQALVGVALENNFIPVGMEQFHAAPTSQWNVIKKMIDERAFIFLLLVVGMDRLMKRLVKATRRKSMITQKARDY